MNVALRKPAVVEQFLLWADGQEERFEFDGLRPVAMTGGTATHNTIMKNIHAALRARLLGTPCDYYGPDLGIRTLGDKVRFPDALVTCTRFPGTDRLAPNPLVVFEVVSPDSGRRDRIEKLREYGAVPSILCYAILESTTSDLLVLSRERGSEPWTAVALTVDDIMALPGIGIEIPVAEFYLATDLSRPAS